MHEVGAAAVVLAVGSLAGVAEVAEVVNVPTRAVAEAARQSGKVAIQRQQDRLAAALPAPWAGLEIAVARAGRRSRR